MLALANSTNPYLVPAIIAAVAAVAAALISGVVAWRSQSYTRFLQDVEDIVNKSIKKWLRRFLGDPRGRRWYDGDEDRDQDRDQGPRN